MEEEKSGLYLAIVWTNDYHYEQEINGVEVSMIKSISIEKQPKSDGQVVSQVWSTSYSTISLSQKQQKLYYKLKSRSPNKFYVMTAHESGGGGSYHQIQYLWLGQFKEELIAEAKDYAEYEHRENQCSFDDCNCAEEREKTVKELRESGSCCMSSTGRIEGASFGLYQVPLVPNKSDKTKKMSIKKTKKILKKRLQKRFAKRNPKTKNQKRNRKKN